MMSEEANYIPRYQSNEGFTFCNTSAQEGKYMHCIYKQGVGLVHTLIDLNARYKTIRADFS